MRAPARVFLQCALLRYFGADSRNHVGTYFCWRWGCRVTYALRRFCLTVLQPFVCKGFYGQREL